MISDLDHCVIYQHKIKIRIYMIPHIYVLSSPVGVERRLDITVLADPAEHFLQKGLFFFPFAGRKLIIGKQHIQVFALFLHQFLIITVVQFFMMDSV